MNAPKKVGCVGTDGIERPQLVKVEFVLTVTCTKKKNMCFYIWEKIELSSFDWGCANNGAVSLLIRMVFIQS